jgi:hypothetical protein
MMPRSSTDVIPSPSWYRRRSPFLFFALLTKNELDAIDGFVELARDARKSEEERLERLAAQTSQHAPDDDWLVDYFAQLDDFAALSAEFAIIGLWRCVELYRGKAIRIARTRAIRVASGGRAATRVKELLKLRLGPRIRCATTVNELRCLNDAIKHARRVDGELADLPRWRGKKDRELGNLEGHYARLRSAAERYLSDLAHQLSRQIRCHPGKRPQPVL